MGFGGDGADVQEHFEARADKYDHSSNWVTDPALRDAVLAQIRPGLHSWVLDVACGTGLVSAWFKNSVAKVVGVDITQGMVSQAVTRLDHLVLANATELPFGRNLFEVVISRQGIQFMDDAAAVKEMVRVAKPGGVICLVHLCAHGEADRDEYFEILRLRNPARRNFYMRGDLERLLLDAGCEQVEVAGHISRENIDVWTDHGAINEDRREAIRGAYRDASPAFRELHAVEADEEIVDHMLFGIAVGRKPMDPSVWLNEGSELVF